MGELAATARLQCMLLGDRDHILISGPSNLNNFLDLPPTCFSLLSFSLQQRGFSLFSVMVGRFEHDESRHHDERPHGRTGPDGWRTS